MPVLNLTIDPFVKPVPVIVMVTFELPTDVEFGNMLVIVGVSTTARIGKPYVKTLNTKVTDKLVKMLTKIIKRLAR